MTTVQAARHEGKRRRSTSVRPTDDSLLDAARAVFAEHGFKTATMSAIAERCDSTKPTLYAHFGDKEALYRRLLEREADVCRGMLFSAYERHADLGLREQVRADTQALFDYIAANPEGFQLIFGSDITSTSGAVRETLLSDIDHQLRRRIEDYLVRKGAEPSSDVQQLAVMLAAVAVSAARHAIDEGRDLQRASAVAGAFSAAALANL
ncbi:MAG TPA: helix-turn-helix domain-containing protein [Marmoricola sp.]|jgi:AcrR family transcriptional regulator|nr:helix-turn-helix domain-containing protein [Marmoricola sp.]